MSNAPPIQDVSALQLGAARAAGASGIMPCVSAINASGQSIPSGASTIVTGWSVAAPQQNYGGPPAGVAPPLTSPAFDPTTGIFVAPNDGTYEISAQLQYAAALAAVGDEFRVEVWRTPLGGVPGAVAEGPFVAEAAASAKRGAIALATLLLGAGDQITIQAFQSQGGPVALVASGLVNRLAIRQVI